MPGPRSERTTSTASPSRRAVTVTSPFPSMASAALRSRFRKTCASRRASARTGGKSRGNSSRTTTSRQRGCTPASRTAASSACSTRTGPNSRRAGRAKSSSSPHDGVDALRLRGDAGEEVGHLGGWRPALHPRPRQLGVAGNGPQGVPDLMRDARREPAHRGQPLRAEQLLARAAISRLARSSSATLSSSRSRSSASAAAVRSKATAARDSPGPPSSPAGPSEREATASRPHAGGRRQEPVQRAGRSIAGAGSPRGRG